MQWENKRITSGLVVKQGIYQVNHPDVQELVLVKKEAEEAQARKTAFKLYEKQLGIYKRGMDVLSIKNKDKRWSARQFYDVIRFKQLNVAAPRDAIKRLKQERESQWLKLFQSAFIERDEAGALTQDKDLTQYEAAETLSQMTQLGSV